MTQQPAGADQSSTASDATTARTDTELLYIQMEYCPKTLKTVLDMGILLDDEGRVDEAGAWQVANHAVSFQPHFLWTACCQDF